ncbi:cell envelope integrity protein CreD [Undibacterium parvum]|uniref:Cell envelope integrity protein CreD n=1 Tax=Undibacterium parvum TaxID=401471 RepID=A0A3S9HIK0_9BURK|nr:cell envelope integrity protein CreD [Undibacterium parvum]AZP11888.1 cell envelope integrity protein CreD [Undibacterium parvum]
MQRTLLFKTLIVALLMLLIGVPLMMIQATISDRMRFRDAAVRSIAADSVSEQTLLGPILVLPYSETYEEQEIVDSVSKKTVARRYTLQHKHLVYPNDLKLTGTVDTDHRYRGIHKVLVYSGQHIMTGDFTLPLLTNLARSVAGSELTAGQPYIALGLSDTRGLRNFPSILWNGKPFEFKQESKLRSFGSGLHAPLELMALSSPEQVKFSLDLTIDGIERMHFVPIAKNNQVSLTSKWPHPQFGGRFLPTPKERKIDQNGFSATWNISALASSAQQQFSALELGRAIDAPAVVASATVDVSAAPAAAMAMTELDSFSVAFIEPINVYSQADRAIKYGMLFVALTFAAFFLFEILKSLPIHPIQYTLVGLALALFFLLLVSLSEHISFAHAYLLAGGGCILLIAFYLSFVLHSWQRGLGFGGGLCLLYGALFGLLQSENNALIMGSILLFAVLTSIMVVTRKVNWYQLGNATSNKIAP